MKKESMRNVLAIAAAAVAMQLSAISWAQTDSPEQQLSLFEAVESSNNAVNNSPSRPSRETRATISEPEFTLVGTSRIGSRYSAIVRHRDGDEVLVQASGDGNTSIEGHGGYAVVDISSKSASIRYPGGIPCLDFPDQGVRCSSAGNIAELALANAEPLEGNNGGVVLVDIEEDAVAADGVPADPANPFEVLRNNRLNAQEDENGARRFVPRRINPEDVPEGMRIIATPFGDRLVEE